MSSHQTKSKSQSFTGASRWSVALRLFMLLAAWSGPMPWCHCHGTLSDADLASAPAWLAKHLQSYHGSVSPVASIFFGWHMHAVYPGTSTDDPDQPKRAEQFRLPAAGESLADHLNRPADAWSVSIAPQIEHPAGRLFGLGELQQHCAASFFDRFAPTLPLPLRFCVARC